METKLQQKIKEGNIAFNKMSKSQKRVAIAKDVLKQIKIQNYVAEKGTYLKVPKEYISSLPPQELLCNVGATCTCCAIGAVFASKVRIGNKFTGSLNAVSEEGMISNVSSIFSKKEMSQMECAFELWDDEGDEFMKFGLKYSTAEKRMIAIMKNIIKNNGKFKP